MDVIPPPIINLYLEAEDIFQITDSLINFESNLKVPHMSQFNLLYNILLLLIKIHLSCLSSE
jgi:hypothetical protein